MLVFESMVGWWVLGALGVLALVGSVARRPAPVPERVDIDAVGVRRVLSDGRTEAVAWEDLVAVVLRTTSEGPFVEDVWWLLVAHDGTGVAVPGALAGPLLPYVWRLPDADASAVIRAMGCTEDATFPVWQGARGDGRACGVEVPSGGCA